MKQALPIPANHTDAAMESSSPQMELIYTDANMGKDTNGIAPADSCESHRCNPETNNQYLITNN